ncbi:MAG: DUF393 domain-containing protein [Crocinitomicaceae bacterium]|nr:DUF393 domain-containing protein [Crocinitomicaceae bacterium]
MNNNNHRIVFFDGVCGLCNSFVDRLIRWDSERVFFYAPLQGMTAGKFLDGVSLQNMESIVYMRFDKVYMHSSAVLMIFNDLGGWRRAAIVLYAIPPFIRNSVYRYVAKNRYKWFGKRSICRIPTHEERIYFLD